MFLSMLKKERFTFFLFRASSQLVSPNRDEALAVDCRQELDLKIGCAFTRFQTSFFHGKYSDCDSKLISYGPCQTPTLYLCVQRANHIAAFQSEQFYKVIKINIFAK